MAFKKVTSGLTTHNDVINELITFMTVDLNSPWLLDLNDRPTAADAAEFGSLSTSRVTILSKVPSQANVLEALARNQFVAVSPIARMQNYLRNSTIGIQIWASVGKPQASPATAPKYTAEHDGGTGIRDSGDNRTSFALSAVQTDTAGPFTSLTMFGPEQPLTSPKGQNDSALIPNYVYFVIEFAAGRFSHGMLGEWKKFVPFLGGWGAAGHDRNTNNDVENISNATMWNGVHSNDRGKVWCTADNGQGKDYGTGDNQQGLSPKPILVWCGSVSATELNNDGIANIPVPLIKWGHPTPFRDFMTGPSRAVLSGFDPLVTPFVSVGDWFNNSLNIDNAAQDWMPAFYPEDFFLGDITNFEAGVEVDVGGIRIMPYPITSALGGSPSSNYGGYFYRIRE